MVISYVVFILLILIPGEKSDLITTITEPPNTELPTSTFEDSTTELLATEQNELLPKISGNVMGSLVHEHPLQLNNYTTESFDDWSSWSERYPLCTDLRFRSPIPIDREKLQVGIKMKSIFVHSKLPVDDCLFLSVVYKEKNVKMEAVTITALPNCHKRLTYISGGGRQQISLRYFKRGVFFFTNSSVGVEQSLHQIFGKKFQMGILLEFVARNEKDYTQVYIMVETKSPQETPENPVFKALERSFEKLTEEVRKELSVTSEGAIKQKGLHEECRNSEKDFLKAKKEIEMFEQGDYIGRVELLLKNIKRITNQDLEKLESIVMTYSKEDLNGSSTESEERDEPKAVTDSGEVTNKKESLNVENDVEKASSFNTVENHRDTKRALVLHGKRSAPSESTSGVTNSAGFPFETTSSESLIASSKTGKFRPDQHNAMFLNISVIQRNESTATDDGKVDEKLQEMKNLRQRLLYRMEHETLDWAFRKLNTLLVKVDFAIQDITQQQSLEYSLVKLKRMKDLLRTHNIGIPGENSTESVLYESPDAVHKDLHEMKEKMAKFETVSSHHKQVCSTFRKFQEQRYPGITLTDPFQISWFFPDTGGYFLYEGSNPFPGCELRDKTIVFESPLIITSEQLQLFQNLPSLMGNSADGNSMRKVDKVIPVLSRFPRPVWHVQKPPVFMNDDGFHKRSDPVRSISGKSRTSSDNSETDAISGSTVNLFKLYNILIMLLHISFI